MAPRLPQEGADPQTQLWAALLVPGVKKAQVSAISAQNPRSGSTEALGAALHLLQVSDHFFHLSHLHLSSSTTL